MTKQRHGGRISGLKFCNIVSQYVLNDILLIFNSTLYKFNLGDLVNTQRYRFRLLTSSQLSDGGDNIISKNKCTLIQQGKCITYLRFKYVHFYYI